MCEEAAGEHTGIQDCLRGSIGANGVHRVRGIAEQGDPLIVPCRERVAVDHRKHEGLGRRRHKRGYVKPVECPVGKTGEHIVEVADPVPVFSFR